ncbi:Rha family transcriptional regulator [Paenibacillus medicaginis]|uniref:Rha family transcriptional regulator n=1 Tax=Paenibacillus medicaginis TaxID=1470560 RepID=A0ABV5C0L9_9BACL
MTQLVYIDKGRPVTDSLTVAEVFQKRHADVIRSIVNLECSEEFNERNFALVNYIDGKGETRPKYIITEKGFSFLVMGYTGKEAAQFKEAYINEFERMKEALNKPNVPALDPNAALAVALRQTADMMDKLPQIVSKLEHIEQKVESQITLDSGQQRTLQQAINKKGMQHRTGQRPACRTIPPAPQGNQNPLERPELQGSAPA